MSVPLGLLGTLWVEPLLQLAGLGAARARARRPGGVRRHRVPDAVGRVHDDRAAGAGDDGGRRRARRPRRGRAAADRPRGCVAVLLPPVVVAVGIALLLQVLLLRPWSARCWRSSCWCSRASRSRAACWSGSAAGRRCAGACSWCGASLRVFVVTIANGLALLAGPLLGLDAAVPRERDGAGDRRRQLDRLRRRAAVRRGRADAAVLRRPPSRGRASVTAPVPADAAPAAT